MSTEFRCDCPFTSALDVLGDKWTLVIIKQMLLEDKETFKDFTESEEAIATNILSSRLKRLEELGIVLKTRQPGNRKSFVYRLTERGLALTPVLVELANWSDRNLRELHPGIVEGPSMDALRQDKAAFGRAVEARYRAKLAERA